MNKKTTGLLAFGLVGGLAACVFVPIMALALAKTDPVAKSGNPAKGSPAPKTDNGRASIQVGAKTLNHDFQENELDARNKYLGRWLEVKGHVKKIFIDNGTGFYLSTDNQFDTGVKCLCDKSQIAGLRTGNVKLVGYCSKLESIKEKFGPFEKDTKIVVLTDVKILQRGLKTDIGPDNYQDD